MLFVVGVVAQGGAKVGHPLRIAGAAGRYVCYAGLLLEAGRCAAQRLACSRTSTTATRVGPVAM